VVEVEEELRCSQLSNTTTPMIRDTLSQDIYGGTLTTFSNEPARRKVALEYGLTRGDKRRWGPITCKFRMFNFFSSLRGSIRY